MSFCHAAQSRSESKFCFTSTQSSGMGSAPGARLRPPEKWPSQTESAGAETMASLVGGAGCDRAAGQKRQSQKRPRRFHLSFLSERGWKIAQRGPAAKHGASGTSPGPRRSVVAIKANAASYRAFGRKSPDCVPFSARFAGNNEGGPGRADRGA